MTLINTFFIMLIMLIIRTKPAETGSIWLVEQVWPLQRRGTVVGITEN